MIEKLKSYAAAIAAVVIAALSFLLSRKTKQLESVESELASEKAQGAIRENEQDRQAAREHANDLVEDYERLKK